MEGTTGAKARRPLLVWVISIFYFATIARALLALYFIYSGAVQVSPEQRELLTRVTTLEWAITLIGSAAGLAGAVMLFRLKKAAFPLFLAFLVVGVGLAVWPWFTGAGFEGVSWQVLLSTFISKGILAGACMYIWDLAQDGVLT
jgi:hypothetical protein